VTARAALALLLSLLACSCATPPVSASPSPTAPLTRAGGTLRVAIASDLASLDPWTATDADSLVVLRQVFESLVDLEPGGYRVVPKLALRWTTSQDGLTWTFTLRSGVRFHDNTVLDAAAVAYNFERAKDFARFDLATIVSSVAATGPSTVVFALRSPYAPLLATLASPAFGMVSPACLKQGPSWASPASRCAAGTGPFRIEAGGWRAGDRVTLERNAGYWGTDAAGQRLPYLDGIVFRPVRDEATRSGALKSAAVDVAMDLGPSSARLLRADPNMTVARRPFFATSFLGIAPTSRPLDLPAVRRAIAMAIDRGAIAQTVYGGDARPASQLIPPGLLGYDDSVTQFAPNDVAAAKKLLADAGYAQGFATDLWYASEFTEALPDPRRVADAIAADLAKIGIAATVRAKDADAFAADARAGALPLWLGVRAPGRADPDDFLSDATPTAAAQELLRRARGETDESKRSELYKQVTKIVQQEVSRVPLFAAAASLGTTRRLAGIAPQPVGGESFAATSFGP
jgi:peptide/nickel transport system substrate-binding protein